MTERQVGVFTRSGARAASAAPKGFSQSGLWGCGFANGARTGAEPVSLGAIGAGVAGAATLEPGAGDAEALGVVVALPAAASRACGVFLSG